MLLTVKADTSVKDLVIDYIEVICESGRSISLNWEQSNVRKTETGFYADYLGVCFNDKLADGKLHELYGMQVDVIGLYSEQKGKLDIDVKEMYFYEDDKELTFDNPYQTEDNEAYMEYKSNLEKFIKTQVQDCYEEDFEAFSEDGDESGIYDIVYDMIPLIEPLVMEGIKDIDTVKAAVLNCAGLPYKQEEIEEAPAIEEWLSGKRKQRMYLRFPKKGTKEKLVELAAKNAELVLKQDKDRIKREEGRTIGAMKEVAEWIGLSQITRVEAFDISNTSGFENVGSMVVFENGKPKRSDYRKFRMKTVSGPDDYACMREVLTRRFTHGLEEAREMEGKELDKEYGSFTKFPDLLLMDGGRGQVNIAKEVLEELHLQIPVCGMVKDDHHRTRGLYYQNVEIPIDIHSEGFKLITRIQDEAHRFAIEYHRSLRSKEQVRSVLDEIPGVGPARRKALMKHFDSIEDIKTATADELHEKAGIPLSVAEEIYSFFHGSVVE